MTDIVYAVGETKSDKHNKTHYYMLFKTKDYKAYIEYLQLKGLVA